MTEEFILGMAGGKGRRGARPAAIEIEASMNGGGRAERRGTANGRPAKTAASRTGAKPRAARRRTKAEA